MMRRSLRISKELSQLEREPPPGVSCWMKNESTNQLQAQIIGDEKTPYSDGVFDLEIQVPERYPMEPPKVQFLTPIYHPNIDSVGRICLDLLKMPPSGNWKPSLSIGTLLTSIKLLMSQPNPDDPLMADISTEFLTNRVVFEQKAREHTHKHAVQKTTAVTSPKQVKDQSDSNDSDQSESSSDESDQSGSSSDESHSPADQLAIQEGIPVSQAGKRLSVEDLNAQPHAKKHKAHQQ
ncbi:ubiquitin-conjugating enzyme E2 T-like isoform X4 [Patiria miniata]|uniref:Ubiquitin-conjugating enzyme E2 T n=1 Tax=Patiria miniata TaxID=46514 RepID=A0A913ZQU7_PATMI|nr:ubiquitin-conjugating enzyme E2 T-like isoform X4 [Patiria miniata]